MKVRKLSNNNCIREMVKFKFSNGGRKCIRQTLQTYQSGFGTTKYFLQYLAFWIYVVISIPIKGESEGYTVKSMEKDFAISNYPLLQTQFLYDPKQGKMIFKYFFWSNGTIRTSEFDGNGNLRPGKGSPFRRTGNNVSKGQETD